jgi:hypothetical protein
MRWDVGKRWVEVRQEEITKRVGGEQKGEGSRQGTQNHH